MADVKNKYTRSQNDAINYRSTDLLVSAAAGSGKTQVLTERIIGIISGEKVSVENILAITFTKLAAAEMKERVKSALNNAYAERRSDFLREEINKVDYADITTIDSFCFNLIKKYFYVLGVDPNFKVLEETDAEELKNQAIDNVFTALYDDFDEDFQNLLSVFSANRRDAYFREAVKDVLRFCESEESIDVVLKKSLKTATEAKQIVNETLINRAKRLGDGTIAFLKELENSDEYKQAFKEGKSKIEKYEKAARYYSEISRAEEFDENSCKVSENKKLCAEIPELTVIISSLKNLGETFKSYKPFFEHADEDSEFEKSLISKLFALVSKVEQEYDNLKAEAAAMSFSDLGKKTLELLSNEEVLDEIKGKYAYIFVDEYQDVNGVQDAVVNKLLNNNGFMVGDLKQSIYGFRGSDPDYFKAKSETFERDGKKVIFLDKNFRCAEKIVEFVNEVFSMIMDKESCGADYAKNPMEYGGLYNDGENEYEGKATIDVYADAEAKFPEYKGVYSVIYHDELNKSAKRAEYGNRELAVVKLVQDEVNKRYYDLKEPVKEKRYKKIEYKDIAVIMGKTKGDAEKVAAALNDFGIPASFENKDSVLNYPEVKAITALAEFLDLSASDVPLASAMLNFGGFTERELADIRSATADKKATFCACVNNAAENGTAGENLKNKITAFCDYVDKMRLFAEFGGAAETLRRIVSDTGYDLKLLSSVGGKEKLKRVNLLISGCEKSGEKSTMREFLDYVNANASALSVAAETDENAVKIMSIHGSKGLEFPVVILYGTENKFNYSDANGKIVLSREYGVAVKTYNPDKMTVRDNIVRKFISDEIIKNVNREEIRKLYVALTRAKYSLHVLVGGKEFNNSENVLLKEDAQYKMLLGCALPVNYIEDLDCVNVSDGVAVAGNIVDEKLVRAISENLTYKYPFEGNETLPVKTSVSKINDDGEEYYEIIDLSGEEPLDASAAEVGTAYHKFLELADFYSPAEKTFDELVKNDEFGEARHELIDVKKLQNILNMPVFEEIRGGRHLKELKFCALLSGESLGYTGATDKVLVQGVADLISIKDGKATLIDYKYSAVKNDEDVVKKYKKQLMLYKYAIENVLKTKVEKVYIINVLQLKQICVNI